MICRLGGRWIAAPVSQLDHRLRAAEQPDGAFGPGQVNDHAGAAVFLTFDFDFAAVFTDDPADDQQAQAGAGGFGRAVGLEDRAHDLGRDPAAIVLDGNPVFVVVAEGPHGETALVRREGLIGVADQIVEDLLELAGVDHGGRHGGGQIQLHDDVAGAEFGVEEPEGFPQCRMQILAFAARRGRAHGMQELLEDGVQPLDFRAGGGEVFLQRGAVAGGQLAELPAEQLEMDVQ